MKRKFSLLLAIAFGTLSCTQPVPLPETPIHKIYELCGKKKTDAAVIAKFKQLGLEDSAGGGGDYSRYHEPKSRTDYKLVSVTINPQPTYNTIQGIFITWKNSPGLTYEEVQQSVGITLPKRGSTSIHTSDASGDTRFYVQNQEQLKHPDSQVTVTCAKNNYDVCWQIDIACFAFTHPD